ncbi:MAG: menaquinone biosynthetic enzyme MqnA/MqnD family protein [Vicinamibacterales bacterium]
MSRTAVGAVGYLNARPLTWALDQDPARWDVRYDRPAVCARLLAERQVALGLIPSVEYLSEAEYRLVPGVGIVSNGAVASVALFSRVPLSAVRRIALDTSSRTSVALTKILCRQRFGIDPAFVPHGPDVEAMLQVADAALLIGDPAFDLDHASLGLLKVDLGSEWTALTGLPFVYAAWVGRQGAADADLVEALQAARAEGVRATEAIAAEYAHGDTRVAEKAARYLRDNVRYVLGEAEVAGLQRFLDLAVELGLAPRRRLVEFF